MVSDQDAAAKLLTTMTDITDLFDEGLRTDVMMLDFRKAFDSVSHTKLLSKLRHCGLDTRW